jgi:ubiquinone/menaquinone biosynthesis C-methylase UbiE
MEHQERVAKLFDQLADTYDAVGVEFFKPIAAGLVSQLAPQSGERAVDVGCGRGAVLFPLSAAVGPNGAVTGLDLSPRMVQATAADAARAGIAVDVRVGDAMAPDLPGGSYEVLASSLVLFFLPDPLAALRAWRALLVDGGRIGVSTFGPYDRVWADRVDSALRSHTPQQVIDARTTGRQGPFSSDEGMEMLLTEAGFRAVRTARATVAARFDDSEHWYRWSMSVGQRQFWEAVAEDDREKVRTELFAAVEGCRDDQGRIGFDQQIRYTLGVR